MPPDPQLPFGSDSGCLRQRKLAHLMLTVGVSSFAFGRMHEDD